MALGKCQDCRGTMSDSAQSCPNCGSRRRPLKQVIRRVIITCDKCGGDKLLYRINSSMRFCGGGWENSGPILDYKDIRGEDIERMKKFVLSNANDVRKVRIDGVEAYTCWRCQGTGRIYRDEVSEVAM